MKKYNRYIQTKLFDREFIPEHWTIAPVKTFFYRVNEKSFETDPTVLSLARDKIKVRDLSKNFGQIARTYVGYNIVKKNDFLLNPMDLYSGANCNVSYVEGVISPAYINLRIKKNINICICVRYYDYYFKNQYIIMALYANGKGISGDNRWTLPQNILMNYLIPIPPFEEQKQIANYLDWKINEIDKLIEKEQIKLFNFNYLRKTLINTVVFQGLDKNKKIYRDIKLTWFKKTPYDWKQVKIKYIFSERVEKNHPEEQLLVSSQSMGVIPKKQYLTRTVEVLKDFHLLKLVKKGDFVISLRSFQGGIEYSDFQGIISPAYTILVLDKNVMLPMYFKYLGKTFDFIQLLKTCVTGIREGQNIDYFKLKNHVISIPTQQEQIDIVNYLDSNIKLIDKIISAYNNKIVLLNELKNSIISEVVTGKIDVRDVVIPKYEKLNVNQVGKEDSFKEGIENDGE